VALMTEISNPDFYKRDNAEFDSAGAARARGSSAIGVYLGLPVRRHLSGARHRHRVGHADSQQAMNQHLAEISQCVSVSAIALLLDGAGWRG